MRNSAHAFTLVEVLASIVVIGLVAGVTLPLVAASFEGYTTHTINRDTIEKSGFALDRVTALLRGTPLADDTSGLGITDATPSSLTLSDGTGLRLDGQDLLFRVISPSGPQEHLLLDRVTRFELTFLADDGVTSTLGTPAQTHCVHVYLERGGLALARAVFPRARLGVRAPGPQ